jgi:NAD(P)-dependent dehydrogenase (short-subunit alcohol dehydrogenase family)
VTAQTSLADRMLGASGKVVLITGAAGQLGAALADAFHSLGATVLGADVKPPAGSPACAEFLEMDVSNEASVAAGFERAWRRYDRVDVLINNAGVAVFTPLEERTEAELDWVIDVNVKGALWCIKRFSSRFQVGAASGGGAVVNIASVFGVVAPDPRVYTDTARNSSEIYGATKAALIQMTRYFAVHLAPRNIRVNCVSPGGILNSAVQREGFVTNYTARCPMARMAAAEDIVGGVAFLASQGASYITGQNLIIDGGLTCW